MGCHHIEDRFRVLWPKSSHASYKPTRNIMATHIWPRREQHSGLLCIDLETTTVPLPRAQFTAKSAADNFETSRSQNNSTCTIHSNKGSQEKRFLYSKARARSFALCSKNKTCFKFSLQEITTTESWLGTFGATWWVIVGFLHMYILPSPSFSYLCSRIGHRGTRMKKCRHVCSQKIS